MRNFPLFFLVCALSFLPFSIEAQVNDPETSNRLVQSYLTQGDSLLKLDGHGDRARLWYKKAAVENPENAITFHKIGRSFLGDYFQGNGPQAYLDSTVVYENLARGIDTEYVDAYWNEVLAYRQRLQHGMTRKVLLEALEYLPKDPEILMLMGRNYFDTGNPGLALPYLEKSIELGGESAPGVAYRFAGWCWFYLEDHEQQLEYFNRFREIDPESLMGIAGQVHSYTGLEEYKKATSLAIQIKDENPEYDYPAYLEAYIGETLLFGGKDEEAIAYYEKAYALDSTSQNLFATRAVTTTLGYLYWQEGNEVDGRTLLEKTIARRTQEWQEMPERWEFSFDIASAYAAMGEMDQAFQWLYTSVLTGYPGHLWKKDPLFALCHDSVAFQQLVQQARIRVEGEHGK